MWKDNVVCVQKVYTTFSCITFMLFVTVFVALDVILLGLAPFLCVTIHWLTVKLSFLVSCNVFFSYKSFVLGKGLALYGNKQIAL